MKLLVTGASGLIGSEVCAYFLEKGHVVHGIDNNQREKFFGPDGDTTWRRGQLEKLEGYHHHAFDIRNREAVLECLKNLVPDAMVHAAAQPSHDLAARLPFDDFDTNATGTLNLLEAARRHAPKSPFILMSTNKVYGDGPNAIPVREGETRWEYDDPAYTHGISETFSIDQCLHSLFGASKVAADVLTQEYGRYFDMPTCVLRGGCLTGPGHAGTELHGFLSYLCRSNVEQRPYTVFGYKGKQVRDNIHSYDVVRFIEMFIEQPRIAEVYNIGGGFENSCSILEAFAMVEAVTGRPQQYTMTDDARIGDHICYYSDLSKMKTHYPDWDITISLKQTIEEIVAAWQARRNRN